MQQIQLVNTLSPPGQNKSWPIRRRSFFYGLIESHSLPQEFELEEARQKWVANQPILLVGALKEKLALFNDDIANAELLYKGILEGKDVDDLLAAELYEKRLMPEFELLAARYDAGDEQEICSVDFDTHVDGEIIEDIWVRVSWLSFEEEDSSLRFRFSFGMEGYDDVSQDLFRQQLAATLEERIFPESAIISENKALYELVANIIDCDKYQLLERIVYYNAPNGGAQFHHDAEKGHSGVVYAQLSGKTFWLALSKQQLVTEITSFISNQENHQQLSESIIKAGLDDSLLAKLSDSSFVDQALNDLFHPELMQLLNVNKAFFSQLVEQGYAYFLEAGDVILLPQESMSDCAWHAVFCIGDKAGQALSFAIKELS